MNENLISKINIVLNQWSLSIQVAILSVFVIIFFALKLKSHRRAIHSWFWAWFFNAMALFMVIFVLFGGEYFSPLFLRIFYTTYAISKCGFAILLFIGLFQLLKERNPLTKNQYLKLYITALLFAGAILTLELKLLTIQIIVYLIVGSIFFLASLLFFKSIGFKDSKLILFIFLAEGLLFLQHAVVLIPVTWGEPLPHFMTHISFFDAILELVVGISCLYVFANQVINEITNRNLILSKSQSTLRKLVNIDPLTNLWHRRYFDTFLKQHNNGASLIFMKIDQLHEINEEWGFSVGDLCIKEVSQVMRETFTNEDGLFRIKGNSFLIITPAIDQSIIKKTVQKLKNKVASKPLCAPILSLTISVTTYQQKSELQNVLLDKN